MVTPHLLLHQKDGISWLHEHKRGILADEAGLAKTRQVLEAAKPYMRYRNMLVICPTSIIDKWWYEAERWGFPKDRLTIVGTEHGFLKNFETLRKGRWAVIVVDECHDFRRIEAERSRKLLLLLKKRDSRLWFLSGTPIVKGAMDFFVPFSLCEPGVHGKYKEFCEKYCKEKDNQWKPGGKEYYGVHNPKAIKAILQRIMLRRYKKDHLLDLPSKLISHVPMAIESRAFDKFTDAGLVKAVLKQVEAGGDNRLDEAYAETIQELGLKKVPYVAQFIKDKLSAHPLVVFAHHRLVLYDIAERLRDMGRKVHVIIGGMDKSVKFKYIQQFQKGQVDDLVCGILAGGTGHDFFRSSHCVFAEFPWTFAAMEQAEDRLHRLGQINCVNVYRCYAKDTFEDAQLRRIEERKSYTAETVGIK